MSSDTKNWLHAKKKSYKPSESINCNVVKKHKEFMDLVARLDMKNAVFIDETGSSPGINRVFARGPKSETGEDRQPCNRGKNISMVAALGVNGLTASLL